MVVFTRRHSRHIGLFFLLVGNSRGDKYQLMATSLLREVTEPAVFVPEVAKQHDVCVRAIAFGELVSAGASFWLDEIIQKFFECFNEDLTKPALIPSTGYSNMSKHGCHAFHWVTQDWLKGAYKDLAFEQGSLEGKAKGEKKSVSKATRISLSSKTLSARFACCLLFALCPTGGCTQANT